MIGGSAHCPGIHVLENLARFLAFPSAIGKSDFGRLLALERLPTEVREKAIKMKYKDRRVDGVWMGTFYSPCGLPIWPPCGCSMRVLGTMVWEF